MSERRAAPGIDFGTESARALVVDVRDGTEPGTALFTYPHGVIDEQLPDSEVTLPADWALQHPGDWLEALAHCVPEAPAQAAGQPEEVVGIGIDFTSSTVLPIDEAGRALCLKEEFRLDPNAWAKLWKHHASQPQADLLNETARRMAKVKPDPYQPNPQATAVYDRLYREYEKLHDYFGRGENDVMRLLKRLKLEATG